jgi:hypothetical protein
MKQAVLDIDAVPVLLGQHRPPRRGSRTRATPGRSAAQAIEVEARGTMPT